MNALRGKSNRHLPQKTMSRKIRWATFKIFTDILNVHVIQFLLDPVNIFHITEFKCVCMLSHFSHVQLFATLWTVTLQRLCPWDSPGKNTGVDCPALL